MFSNVLFLIFCWQSLFSSRNTTEQAEKTLVSFAIMLVSEIVSKRPSAQVGLKPQFQESRQPDSSSQYAQYILL